MKHLIIFFVRAWYLKCKISYAQLKRNLSITCKDVQANLDEYEAAIEFVRYKSEEDSLYYYNALIGLTPFSYYSHLLLK